MASNSSFFSLIASPGTDAWRKPPSVDVLNVPFRAEAPAFPLISFQRASVSFAGQWKERYDQGGLLLNLTHPTLKGKWLKTGVEFYNNRSYISTVSTDAYSDWSIYPTDAKPGDKLTVEAVRESDENGKSLWVYWVKLDESGKVVERLPLREVNWIFAQEDGWQLHVGAYAARPEKKTNDLLEVKFWNLQVEKK